MKGLMQDYPLTLQHVLWRAQRLFDHKEIVSKREDHLHRYSYTEMTRRAARLANALQRLGVRPGDRVATLAWNNYRHLELYYAVPCMGAVLHTLNLRLFPDQLAYVIKDAEDKFLFVDKSLIAVLNQVAGRIPSVRKIVVLSDGGAPPEHQLGETLDYEELIGREA
ncbi:MAG TPA: AMP-binding protein, partial [Streptosporangiaceae bacterium]